MSTERIYLYRKYVRIWHWCQAATILALMLTGLAIHLPERLAAIQFATAVSLHNILAAILLANGVLGLFFYVATGEVRQLIPRLQGFTKAVSAQIKYYTGGIFRGEAHPFHKTPLERMNMLQRATYFLVMFVLLPLQIVSGVVLWAMATWPDSAVGLLALPVLSAGHTLLAWLFAAFLIMHIYLTTTGDTPLSNIKAMVTGWEDTSGRLTTPHGSD